MLNNLKKIYFAGKFNLLKDKNLPLEERLVNDFRAIILGTPKKLTYADDNVKVKNKYIYKGPFYIVNKHQMEILHLQIVMLY